MKKKTNIILCSLILGLLVATMQVDASEFALSQTKIVANIGETVDLDVTGTDKVPVWTSYNVNTAKVNSDGEVTALRKGKTTISARVGLTRKTCAVNVVDSSIKLNKASAIIYVGGSSTNTIQLKATVKGATKNVIWTSSNESIATVNKNGKVTSVSAGTAVITATANGKSATSTIIVKESSISLNMNTMQLSTKGTGSSIKLTANIVGSKKNTQWVSSDKTIATVSGGKVTGKNTGTATITATANGVSASCTVNVIKDSISINEEKVLLYVDEKNQLKTNAGKKDVVTWVSSDASVVTVDAKGLVTAVGEGTAIINASCNETTDACEITVKKTDTIVNEDIVLLKTKGDNKTYALSFSVIGRKNNVKWTSSDKNIVTVRGGKITAKKAGTATITATANGVSDTVQVTVKDFDPTITLNQSEYTLYTVKGNIVALKATVDGNSKKVTWNSSNTAVATVNNGRVTALKEGTALISATANGVTAECIITVKESKVVLETENIWLKKGETAELPVNVIGVSQTMKYATSNSKVATVKNGVITAKNFGEADIKVTANGITSVCHIIVSECEHSFDAGTITKEATCSATGEKRFTCTKCGYAYTESVPKTDHSFILTETVPATCVNSGISKYACEKCEATKQETIEATGHSYGEWQTVIEATELAEGLEKQVCIKCGDEVTRKTEKKAHQHVYVETVTEPTCTEQGYTTHTCACGDTYKDNYVDATGHDWGEWITVKEATNTEEGEKVHTCKKCSVEERESIPVVSHVHFYTKEVIAPTCTEQGYTLYTCECGDTYKDNYEDETGHDWGEWVTVKEATNTEEGEKVHTCKKCNAEERESIPVVSHVHFYKKEVIAPTCTEQGYTTHTCACGDTYKDKYVDALGHSYGEGVITTEATCKIKGIKTYTCSRCNDVYTENIGYGDHKMVDNVIKPTCTLKGYTEHECSVCGYYYTDTPTDELGHSYDEGVVTKEPTCKDFGERTYTCTRCGDSYTISINPTYGKHKYEVNDVLEPTCTEKGYTEYKCSVCGDTYKDEEEPLGHDFGAGEIKTEATDYSLGIKTYTCTRSGCNHSEEHDYALGHEVDLGNGETATVYGYWDLDAANECFELLNAYRVENGLNELQQFDDLSEYAKVRALECAYSYSHNRPNGSFDYYLDLSGENIAPSYSSASDVMQAWKNSSGHNANMLDELYGYGAVGHFINLDYANSDGSSRACEFSNLAPERRTKNTWVQNFWDNN